MLSTTSGFQIEREKLDIKASLYTGTNYDNDIIEALHVVSVNPVDDVEESVETRVAESVYAPLGPLCLIIKP